MTPKQEAFVREYLKCLNIDAAMQASNCEMASGQSGYYVYFLVDGRDRQIFYVGKGNGGRISMHKRQAKRIDAPNAVKASRIRDAGDQLLEIVFVDGLTEPDALRLERDLIERMRDSGLTNIASGSVHYLESQLEQANHMLASILPFEVWLRSAPDCVKDLCTSMHGSPEAAWKQFLSAVLHLISSIEAEIKKIKRKSNEEGRR